jgi:ribose transport system permease protein
MTIDTNREAAVASRYDARASLLARFLQSQYAGALISLVLIMAFLTITQPVFLTWGNLMNIVKANTVVFILALGATYVVIAGAIDLAVASATAACAMIFGLLLVAGVGTVPAMGCRPATSRPILTASTRRRRSYSAAR